MRDQHESPAVKFIHEHGRFIITTHETPDGDAIGSEISLYRALDQLGKSVLIFNADPMPKKFRFLDPEGTIQVLTGGNQLPEDINQYTLIMVDVNDTNNIGQLATLVVPKVRQHFIIDHHEYGDNIITGNHIQEQSSSTCEILFEIFSELGVEVDLPIAEALFVGIVYDTGSFIYPKTTAKTFAIAESLVSKGVSPNEVYTHLYESNSVSSLMLQSRVLGSLELRLGNHVAIQTMTKDIIVSCGASYEEADMLINIPLKSERIRVSVFFKENLEGIKRCSIRSKGNIDVSEIARSYGGGGHATAAGFKVKKPFEEIEREILERLSSYFPDGEESHEQ